MPSQAGASIFTYSLTRPFPSSRYNWFILICSTILTALFTFIAVATNGYELQTIYTTDPNTTESRKTWFEKAPFSWESSTASSCQDAPLTVGGRYLTTNRGFLYNVESIRNGSSSSDAQAQWTYRNSTLQLCDVVEIQIYLARDTQARLPFDWFTWGATTASATTMCTLQSSSGPFQVNFTVTFPPTRAALQIVQNFLTQDRSGLQNMWYGVQITAAWYSKLSTSMGFEAPSLALNPAQTDSWASGTVILTRNVAITDYTDPTFFYCNATVSTNEGDVAWMVSNPTFAPTLADWANQWTLGSSSYKLPNITITVDAFAKSFYSLLLFDFGVNQSNALLDSTGLDYLQSINDTNLPSIGTDPSFAEMSNAGTILPVFDGDASNLNKTQPPTLYLQYLCSVPKLKGIVSILINVLIADMVFLHSCWVIFTMTATWWLGRKDKHMNECEGCAAKTPKEAMEDEGHDHDPFELTVLHGDDGASTRTRDPLLG